MRIALFLLILVVSVLALGKTTLACDCAEPPEQESFRRADVVFEGKVVRVDDAHRPAVFTFAVQKVLKGSAVDEISITGTGTNCDDYFRLNVTYRVYARHFENKLVTGQCSGNRVLNPPKRRRNSR